MLSRVVFVVVLLLTLHQSTLSSWGACKDACGNRSRVCEVRCPIEGLSGSPSEPGTSGGSSSGGTRVCSYNDRKVGCSNDYDSWVPSASAWCQLADTQPPKTDAVWLGRSDGSIYECVRPTGELIPDPGQRYYRWLPDTEATPPDPEELAKRFLRV